MCKIPIVIGVTGHRDIRPDAEGKLKTMVKDELQKLMKAYPSSEFVMLDALASGADLLCADAAMELGLKLYAVLPFETDEYLKDFSEEDAGHFRKALAYASKVQVPANGSPERDDHYRAAGVYIAEKSHICFALWNGELCDPKGCGTSAIVQYITNSVPAYSVYHFVTPRKGEDLEPELKLIESEEGITSETLKITNEFNSDSTEDTHYASADSLSGDNQKKYNHSLLISACTGVMMVVSFMLYDEIYLTACLILYAVLFAVTIGFLRFADRKQFHEKYYKYRMLAESLRVQGVLDSRNIDANAAESYIWTQQDDVMWVKKAIDSIHLCHGPVSSADDSDWIDGQLEYNRRAAVKTAKKRKLNDTVTKVLVVLTGLFILAGCVIEIAAPRLMGLVLWGMETEVWYRVLISTLSAASLFFSSYFGKLALGRKEEDHKDMVKLYSRAKALIARDGLTDSIAIKVAGEEIIENGNWYSYIKENVPDLNI